MTGDVRSQPSNDENRVLVACSVFQHEIEWLIKNGDIDGPVVYLDSNLHMCPTVLKGELETAIRRLSLDNKQAILVFGDCHMDMVDVSNCKESVRTEGKNCIELFVGRERTRQLMREGAFCLFPEWTLRWREIFSSMGFPEEQTKEIIRDNHSRFHYFDTGIIPVPHDELAACVSHFGLPVAVSKIPLTHLAEVIRRAGQRLRKLQNPGVEG